MNSSQRTPCSSRPRSISPIAPPLSIPAYDASQYAAASSPLPITGYNAGSYYDPAHDGEGFIVDIMGNFAGEFGEPLRTMNLAWFTYDQAGRPYWIWGTKTFSPGATRAMIRP